MAKQKKRYPLIRFDWAMKKMLRQKANYDILEGFLSELLKEKVKVKSILESEGNKEDETDKYNRVDIFVENEKGELVIIEVQNTQEYDYFHRILYGVSKAITEYMQEGDAYVKVKKIISITIAYFALAQGEDYMYHGSTIFTGVHKKDVLGLSIKQKELYGATLPADLFPEYWILKIGNYKNRLKDPFDQWMYFLKNAEVLEDFSAQGLPQAKEKLDEMKLDEPELAAYRTYKRKMHDRASEEYNKNIDAQDLIKKGKEEGKEEMILEMHSDGFSVQQIAKIAKKTAQEITEIIAKQRK
jgi:PD-(D/E)XK nuclease family transposase